MSGNCVLLKMVLLVEITPLSCLVKWLLPNRFPTQEIHSIYRDITISLVVGFSIKHQQNRIWTALLPLNTTTTDWLLYRWIQQTLVVESVFRRTGPCAPRLPIEQRERSWWNVAPGTTRLTVVTNGGNFVNCSFFWWVSHCHNRRKWVTTTLVG
jgi:hypothetical protein